MNKEFHYLILDLKDDPETIAEYERRHEKIWPEITEGIKAVGILDMKIFRAGNRMLMSVETPAGFDLNGAFGKLADLPRQKEWEAEMWDFQQSLPFAQAGEKWIRMENIFNLEK